LDLGKENRTDQMDKATVGIVAPDVAAAAAAPAPDGREVETELLPSLEDRKDETGTNQDLSRVHLK
jgi:hypothetical protein